LHAKSVQITVQFLPDLSMEREAHFDTLHSSQNMRPLQMHHVIQRHQEMPE